MMCCNSKTKRHGRILQRQQTIQQEESFRVELEHLFEKHGNQGVEIQELQEALEETAIVDVIPRKKILTLLNKADTNKNSFITYTEFMEMYNKTSTQLTKKEKTAIRSFVGAAIHNIVPRILREDFIQNYTCRPPPIFMIIISIIEISVFTFYAVQMTSHGHAVTAFSGVPFYSPLIYKADRRNEAWRFVTYMFLHQGYFHLIANLLFQLLLGLPLEIVHKWKRVMFVYFCGVIGGSMAHSITDFRVALVGASGGCYAIIGAHLASVIINWKEMNYKCSEEGNPVRVFSSAPCRVAILLTVVTVDTVSAVYRRFLDPNEGNVGVAAHVGGLLTGLLLGIPVMKNVFLRPWEVKIGQHGNQGVEIQELQEALEETAIVDVIPRKKILTLLNKADTNKNSFITYTEFMEMYNKTSTQLTKKEKTAIRSFVGAAIHNIVPRILREDFIQNYTCRPPPIFMIIISIIEISVFTFYAVQMTSHGHAVTAFSGVPFYSPLIYKADRRNEAWRFVTYMFLHQGYFHLIANLLFQLLLGLPLEIVHKWKRVMFVYFCGVIGGSMAHSITDFRVALVGASGGCYAIIGAHLASVIINWKEMNYKCSEEGNPVRVFSSAPCRVAILLTVVTVDTVSAVYRRFLDPNEGNVGVAAHVGGLLTGLLLGIPVMKNVFLRPWEVKIGQVTLIVYVLAVTFCILFNIFFRGYPSTNIT